MAHRARYGGVAQFFHWATAVLVLVAFTFGPGGSEQGVYPIGFETGWAEHFRQNLEVRVFDKPE
ncbi:hypothetical protein [Paraburkholderia sediminicola]|uniref:hypothetical protein n=1 Tax=Paraburkholderia sediminicola TaxID=458836 RepID=UPI0038BB2908